RPPPSTHPAIAADPYGLGRDWGTRQKPGRCKSAAPEQNCSKGLRLLHCYSLAGLACMSVCIYSILISPTSSISSGEEADMCGRFSQYRPPWEYLQPIGLHVPLVGGTDPESVGRFNVAPRSKVRILHLEPDGLRWNFVPWGWAPFWAKGTRPPAINARSETAATGKFFKQIWETGRCVIPADGWYEWVKNPDDPKQKQPYYIHRKDGEPMYFAGIGQFRRDGSGPKEGDGFVIITTDSDQGMVDIHDR